MRTGGHHQTGAPPGGAAPPPCWSFATIPLGRGAALPPLPLQARLAVGATDDPLEREADAVADRVMRMPDPAAPISAAPYGLWRKCAACEEEHGQMRMKAARSVDLRHPQAPPSVHHVLRAPGERLDRSTRNFFEPRLGINLGEVSIHRDAQAVRSAAEVDALAYTVGRHVVFGSGQYAPHTGAGRRLLAHELAHVAQQDAVGSSRGLGHSVSMASPESEMEADRVADAVHTGVPVPAVSAQPLRIARASWTEKWHAFWGVGPIDAYRASEIADESLRAAVKTGLPGMHNGLADAWRHCFWNCRMTDAIGADQAETIANNHEADNPGPILESTMDLANNVQGRRCGGTSCDACCQNKLDTGQLIVIDSTTGGLLPSSTTARTGGTQGPIYEKY
jgi:hypothetical protein